MGTVYSIHGSSIISETDDVGNLMLAKEKVIIPYSNDIKQNLKAD